MTRQTSGFERRFGRRAFVVASTALGVGLAGDFTASPLDMLVTAGRDPARTRLAAAGPPGTAPLAATPVPAPTVAVRLSPGIGLNWCFYDGASRQPEGGSDQAFITTVKNATSKAIKLNYQSASGEHRGPVALGSDQSTDAFSGTDLAGTWRAEVSGLEADAPRVVLLEVTFEPEGAVQGSATPFALSRPLS